MPATAENSTPDQEEALFRHFRPAWLPIWLPARIEALILSASFRRFAAVLGLTLLASYLLYGHLPGSNNTWSGNVDHWRHQIEDANPAQLPLVFEALFQVPDEHVLRLGIHSLLSPEIERRQAASSALEDAPRHWRTWSTEAATRQWEWVTRSLAEVTAELPTPEQFLAVELARQALRWPVPSDDDLRNQILENGRAILVAAPAVDPRLDRERDRRAARDRWATDPMAARGPLPATADSPSWQRNEWPSPADPPGQRWTPAAYAPQAAGTGQASRAGIARLEADSAWQETSQVPLYDDRGRRILARFFDPAQLPVPGGMIPVEMSPSPRALPDSRVTEVARSIDDRRSNQRSEGQDQRHGPSDSAEESSTTGRRIETSPPTAYGPGDQRPRPTNPDLQAALDRRVDNRRLDRRVAPSAQEPSVFSAAGPRSPAVNMASNRRNPDLDRTMEPREELGQAGRTGTFRPGTTPGSATSADETGHRPGRSVPPNPYRPATSGTSGDRPNGNELDRPATQRQPMAEAPPRGSEASGRPAPKPWQEAGAMAGWSHIEVMQALRDPDPNRARLAVRELDRRGFNADYISAARRLTSPQADDRYQLILDLAGSTRVEPTPFLRWLQNDPDPQVQALARQALILLEDSTAPHSPQ